MKALNTILILLIICSSGLIGQNQLQLNKNYNINEKQKKLFKMVYAWMEQQSNFSNITTNEVDLIEAEGYIPYTNPIKYEGSSTMSRAFADQTKGKLSFTLKMIVTDNNIDISIVGFKHLPKNEIDKIDFGVLTQSNEAPDYLKYDYDEIYCDKVWSNMKVQAIEKTELILTTLPEQLLSEK